MWRHNDLVQTVWPRVHMAVIEQRDPRAMFPALLSGSGGKRVLEWYELRSLGHDRVAGYDPLERHRTTTVNAQLDEQAMDAAARSLIGLHDFAAYCKWREGATTIRTLLDFGWRRDDRGILIAQVKADAFCHSMVRALVGACAAVGEGRLDVEDVADIRDEGVRTPDVKVLAARGLTLTEVGYPADELLESRAEQTRAVRRLDEE